MFNKLCLVALFGLSLVSGFSVNAKSQSSGPLLSVDTCFRPPFSSYSEWLTMISAKMSRKNQDVAKAQESINNFKSQFNEKDFERYRATLECQTFQYQSGGALVDGYVIRPKDAKQKLPVIVYNRGGNGNYGSVVMGRMVKDLFPLAAEGFIVVGSQYRGTFEDKPLYQDEFGGADVEDVTSLINLLPAIAGADLNRVGMLGTSRGVMQSYLALRDNQQVKAFVSIAGNTDLLLDLELRPAMEKVYVHRIPNYAQNKEVELKKRSAIHWVSDINSTMPILLIHGEADDKVAAIHSINMAEKLAQSGRKHKFVLYPGDDHDLSKNHQAAFKETVLWFQTYL